MTTRAIVLFILVVSTSLAGCAGGLDNRREAAYDTYWGCVGQAVQPYVLGSPLSARQSVLAAQASCSTAYTQFEDAQTALVQSRLQRDNARLGERLGVEQARVWRRRVTQAMTDYVIEQRR